MLSPLSSCHLVILSKLIFIIWEKCFLHTIIKIYLYFYYNIGRQSYFFSIFNFDNLTRWQYDNRLREMNCVCMKIGVWKIFWKKVMKKFARLHFRVVSLQRDSNAAIGPYIEQARNSKGYRRLRRRSKPTDVVGRQQAVGTILASEQW